MTNGSSIWAIIPAAGAGSRMQSARPKQYLPLLDHPVIQYGVERLCANARVNGVWVGISEGDAEWPVLATQWSYLSKLKGSFLGGATRAQTVVNGLQTLLSNGATPDDWVLVHDAARPCLRRSDLEKLIDVATMHADGGLLAQAVVDTVKRVDATNQIVETVSRQNLWRAQTPQMFRVGKLGRALKKALGDGKDITDEAAAIEADGGRPQVVPGRADNIKITVPEDLAVAELYLRRQQVEGD